VWKTYKKKERKKEKPYQKTSYLYKPNPLLYVDKDK